METHDNAEIKAPTVDVVADTTSDVDVQSLDRSDLIRLIEQQQVTLSHVKRENQGLREQLRVSEDTREQLLRSHQKELSDATQTQLQNMPQIVQLKAHIQMQEERFATAQQNEKNFLQQLKAIANVFLSKLSYLAEVEDALQDLQHQYRQLKEAGQGRASDSVRLQSQENTLLRERLAVAQASSDRYAQEARELRERLEGLGLSSADLSALKRDAQSAQELRKRVSQLERLLSAEQLRHRLHSNLLAATPVISHDPPRAAKCL